LTVPSTSATQNQDVLLFVDNIFRFVQAGSEVSTLLGRCFRRGTSPLADEMGELQERIRRRVTRSRRCRRYTCRPTTTPTPPVHYVHDLDAPPSSHGDRQPGIYPVDPLAPTSILAPRSSASGTTTSRGTQETLQRYKELQDIRILGLDEPPKRTGSPLPARKVQKYQPAVLRR
jgi:F-type H+-transporting ATPase subunit beta